MNVHRVCFLPVHPAEPACSSSWPAAASAPPAAGPGAAARCPAAPVTAAPPGPRALATEDNRDDAKTNLLPKG